MRDENSEKDQQRIGLGLLTLEPLLIIEKATCSHKCPRTRALISVFQHKDFPAVSIYKSFDSLSIFFPFLKKFSWKLFTIQMLVLSSIVNSQYYPYYLGYGSNYGGLGSRPSTYYNSNNYPYQNSYQNPGSFANSYGGSGGWNGITFPSSNNNYGGSNSQQNYGNLGSYYGLNYGFANYNPWQNYWGYGDRKK